MTEVYDFLRVLYARIGTTFSPVSGEVVKRHRVSDVVDFIMEFDEGSRLILLAGLNRDYSDRDIRTHLELLLQRGFNRIVVDEEDWKIEVYLKEGSGKVLKKKLEDVDPNKILVVIDRFVVKKEDEDNINRIGDSVQIAFLEGGGACYIQDYESQERFYYNNRFELDGIVFEEPDPHLFNFNNPYGACPRCEGFGKIMGIDRKSTRLNSSHVAISYAVFCLKKKTTKHMI